MAAVFADWFRHASMVGAGALRQRWRWAANHGKPLVSNIISGSNANEREAGANVQLEDGRKETFLNPNVLDIWRLFHYPHHGVVT
jgi:hypothetical protein